MVSVPCSQCGRELAGKESDARMAAITGSIMGDEYVETYYFCSQCGVYTVEHFHDSFSGAESASVSRPIPKADGDAKVALIRQCETPWDKTCRCEAHRAYFGKSLD